jgi:hypothetical protein
MIPEIKLLFAGPPSKASVENQKILISTSLPLSGRFIEQLPEVFSYLARCSQAGNFPDVIILDADLGEQQLKHFLQEYRQRFYGVHMDSLVYVSGDTVSNLETTDKYPILAGYLCKPLTKAVFLKEIFPLIAFKMV